MTERLNNKNLVEASRSSIVPDVYQRFIIYPFLCIPITTINA